MLPHTTHPLPLIGIISQEWCDWISALSLVPLEPLWVWVLDTRWLRICKGLYPDVVFIYGLTNSLPAVDIMLISRTSLHKYLINLSSVLCSLIVSTCKNLQPSVDWKQSWWQVSHSSIGGATIGEYKLHSLHRIAFNPLLFRTHSPFYRLVLSRSSLMNVSAVGFLRHRQQLCVILPCACPLPCFQWIRLSPYIV